MCTTNPVLFGSLVLGGLAYELSATLPKGASIGLGTGAVFLVGLGITTAGYVGCVAFYSRFGEAEGLFGETG